MDLETNDNLDLIYLVYNANYTRQFNPAKLTKEPVLIKLILIEV